jgi:hypothetical protein
MKVMCECNSVCSRIGEVPEDVLIRCFREDLVLIFDGCAHGPEPGEDLVSKGEGWGLYRAGPTAGESL